MFMFVDDLLAYSVECEMRTLDLFSGIGGVALGMHGTSKPVAYCEINQRCRVVLDDAMRRKSIHRAPIFEDVTKLSAGDLRPLRPVMITAGSPCQDISTANPNAVGVMGPRSRLLFQVFRIADMVPTIQTILLENSAAIMTRGVDLVVAEFAKRGWCAAWTVMDAREVGALHARRRWYLLAVRPGFKFPKADPTLARAKWTRRPAPPRVVADTSPVHHQRCALLGNSVVPHVVARAYVELKRAIQNHALGQDSLFDRTGTRLWLSSNNGQRLECQRPHVKPKAEPLNLQVIVGPPRTPMLSFCWWSTPTHSHWNRPRHPTVNKALRTFSAQVIYEKQTQKYMRDKLGCHEPQCVSVNAAFVEWLMGFPHAWTRAV